jgi:hypothetical protein
MAKISNTSAYPSISNLDSADYLIITDAENELKTKTVTIEQMQTLFGIDTLVAKVTVNTAALLTLGTQSATLIAAPGAGKVIDIISISQFLDAGNTAFNFGNDLTVKIGSGTFGTLVAQSANFAADLVTKITTPTVSTVIAQNTAVTLETAANPTQGTGTMYFNIFYRVLTVGSTF